MKVQRGNTAPQKSHSPLDHPTPNSSEIPKLSHQVSSPLDPQHLHYQVWLKGFVSCRLACRTKLMFYVSPPVCKLLKN